MDLSVEAALQEDRGKTEASALSEIPEHSLIPISS